MCRLLQVRSAGKVTTNFGFWLFALSPVFKPKRTEVGVCKLWDKQLLIHIVKKSTPDSVRMAIRLCKFWHFQMVVWCPLFECRTLHAINYHRYRQTSNWRRQSLRTKLKTSLEATTAMPRTTSIKNEYMFYSRLSHLLCLSLSKLSRNWIWDTAMNLKQKFKKISRGGSRSPDNAEFDHFTLLFCRGRQRNVPRIIMHVHSHCPPH